MAQRRPRRRRSRRTIEGPSSGKAPSQPGKKGASPAPAQPKPQDPLQGRTLGRCRIEERIGKGRTGVVYRAHHLALDTTVAVKVLLPSAAAQPKIVESFTTEARAIAQIDNENVLKIYDVGSEGKFHFIVMELLDGEEVLDLVDREKTLDVTDCLRITRQAANGLVTAHARGFVHRDVKLQNLVLLEDGTVKLVDFGLAAAVDESGRVGTPHYMAPEICEKGQAQEASDVYALGISLYHMLVGKPPHKGKDVAGILRAHIEGKPLEPERIRRGLSKEVGDLVRRLTALDPAARPTAAEIVEELDRIGGDALQEVVTFKRRRRRRRGGGAPSSSAAVLAVVVVIGLIVAVIALTALNRKKPEPSPKDRAGPVVPSTPDPVVPPRDVSPPTVEPDPDPGPVVEPPPENVEPTPEPESPSLARERRAKKALADAEAWARKHWSGPDETESVITNYQAIATNARFLGTEAAKEALNRSRLISQGQMHPHPDRSWASPEEVTALRDFWKQFQPVMEGLIEKHLYFSAQRQMPKPVESSDRELNDELAFWGMCLDHLAQFKTELIVLAPKLPESRRMLETAEGPALLLEMRDQTVKVRRDGKMVKIPWVEITPKALSSIARRAFEDGEAKNFLYLMAFAFAHRQSGVFWDVALDLTAGDAAREVDGMRRQYEKYFETR